MERKLAPCHVDGSKPNACASRVYDQQIYGKFELTGAWTGWRIRGNKILGPAGVRFTPDTLRMAHAGWVKRLPGWDELPEQLTRARPCAASALPEYLDQLRRLDDPTNKQRDLFEYIG